VGRAVTAISERPRGAAPHPTAVRSRNFWGSASRLVKRLAPQRRLSAAVITLGITGTAIGIVVPRILGHATDLLFNGVIGRRLPAGITKAQAITEARTRGDNAFAELLSGMKVVPGRGVDFDAVGRTLALALILYLIAALLLWVQARLLNITVQKTIAALRSDVEDKLHRLPISYFDARQRGELLSRVTNDVDNIQSSLSLTISQLVTSILAVLAALAMMVSISPLLALITVLSVPMLLLATRAITRRSQRLFTAQWTSTGRLNAHIEETYSGFTVVKTFGHQAAAREQFRSLNDDVYRAGFGAQFISGLVQPATTFIGNIGYVAVAVIGGLQVATGHITLGNIQAFIQYVRQFNNPLSQTAGIYNTLQSGVASAERVFELLDEPEESPGPEPASAQTPLPPPPRQTQPPPNGQRQRLSGRVEFEQVNFAYRAGTPVIEDLSMVAEAGSTIAIVGPTGAGKTTLVNLLMRFYDVDSGRILVDGIDITTVSRQTLRSRIGMVLQDTWLFDGTIAENIAYGRPDASAEELVQAAKAAYVDRFVRALPAGYRTRVTGDGSSISAGEKQLITIARAFLARPQILILDEATSSVDTRTEALIQEAMRELRRDRTSFIIAHRLSTIREADRILVVESGRIVEQGTHAELLARRGAYYEMTQA